MLSNSQPIDDETPKIDPFHKVPNELLVLVLDRLSTRQRCRLRLLNHKSRKVVDEYELARSISLYVHDGSRAGELWSTLPNYPRNDLRERLTSLACEFESSPSKPDHGKLFDAVAKRLESLLLGPNLKKGEPTPEFVIDAIVELHHVQRLLVDQERKGLALDDQLVIARRSLESRLVDVCGLRRLLDWPVDVATRT